MAGTSVESNSSLEISSGASGYQAISPNDNPSLNADGFESEPFLCHHHGTVCSARSATAAEKFTWCKTDDDNSPNGELIRALKDFKARSLALKAALEDEAMVNDIQKELSDYVCSCSDPKYVHLVSGYHVECIEKFCSKKETFTQYHENRFKTYSDVGSTKASNHVTSAVAPEEFYKYSFYGVKHWNYCANDEDIGAVIITLKPEVTNPHSKGSFRIMVRSAHNLVIGLLSCSSHQVSLSSRDDVVHFISQQIDIKAPVKLITIPSVPAELLKMDSAFNKQAHKFGVVYMKEGQQTEEQLLGNETHSKAFDDFLNLLGERIRLKGFDKYRGGLDGNNDLTGKYSVFTKFCNSEVMFHVSTLLPFEEFDSQKLQRKRHIGNDIVCIIFMEATSTKFVPDCIKSNFLHTFIIVQVDVENNPDSYTVSVVSRSGVLPYGPPLYDKYIFDKGDEFRVWILKKLFQGEQACHRSPSFAKLHARTRALIMGELLKSVRNSQSQTSAIPRASPDQYMTVAQVSRDFSSVCSVTQDGGDLVVFLVEEADKKSYIGVKSIMSAKSKVFLKMFSQELGHIYAHLPVSRAGSFTAPPELRRTTSSKTRYSGLRSGKMNLEKLRRSRSESDSSHDEGVTLESVTDLQSRKDPERSMASSKMQCSAEVIVVKQFESGVFEALLEFLHVGSCDLRPSLLPGLFAAAQYYQVEELRQVCVESMKQRGISLSCSDHSLTDLVSNNLTSPTVGRNVQTECVSDTHC